MELVKRAEVINGNDDNGPELDPEVAVADAEVGLEPDAVVLMSPSSGAGGDSGRPESGVDTPHVRKATAVSSHVKGGLVEQGEGVEIGELVRWG